MPKMSAGLPTGLQQFFIQEMNISLSVSLYAPPPASLPARSCAALLLNFQLGYRVMAYSVSSACEKSTQKQIEFW